MELKDRIDTLIKEVSKNIFEKETIFQLAFLAMLSGESIFVLGKPGIAKSMIARRMKYALKAGTIFEYLMNRFSTPEEIFGSISIKALQEGKYSRNVEKYLPSANIAFLDEIWKSGPSILNNLLTILNEKLFRNDAVDIKVPLWLLISASNELPEKDKGLEALYDRFIIRYIARPLAKKENFEKMIQVDPEMNVEINEDLKIAETEYYKWLDEVKKVKITTTTLEFIDIFKKSLQDETEGKAYISDRRWTKIVKLMKASAYYNGRNYIDKSDWLVIPYCIWDTYEQETEYREIFFKIFKENLMLDITLATKKINENIQLLLKKIEDIENGLTNFKEYENIFDNKIIGTFYRINGLNSKYVFCYIYKNDYLKFLNNPSLMNEVKIFLGNSDKSFQEILDVHLKYKDIGKLVVYHSIKKSSKENIYIEQINKNNKKELNNLNDQLVRLKLEYNDLIKAKKNEVQRLRKNKNIFLNSYLEMLIDEYVEEEKVSKNIENIGQL